jgi:hypothetical protein
MFWVILALFANFECKCEKTEHFQTFCKKIKKVFFNVYHFPFVPIEIPKQCNIEAFYCTVWMRCSLEMSS